MKFGLNKSRSNRFVTVLVNFALTLSAVYAPSVDASTDSARARAHEICDVLRNEGWLVRDSFTFGKLARGESTTIRCTFYAGNSYRLVAGGCEDARDVDVAVYDENGNLIDSDRDSSSLAVADFHPKWSGTFFVKVKMYDSTPDGAHFVLQYAYRKD
jgi:hypothetical protein